MEFKPGDLIICIDGKLSNRYIIHSLVRFRDTEFTKGFLIYRVITTSNKNILDRRARFIHKYYRLATPAERVLYGN